MHVAQHQRADAFSPLTPDSTVALLSGNEMPVLGLGTLQLTHHTADAVRRALDAGFRMLDTSGDYHTQRGISEVVKWRRLRASLFMTTKVEDSGDAYESVCASLAELKIDYVDLVLLHRSPEHGVGEELWQGLRRAKREGMVRDIGVSNYSIELIEDLVYHTGELPVVNQVEWSPFGHSPRMLDFCRDNDIVLQAASPLTRGTRLNDDKLAAMAARYGKTAAQLLIRWNLQLGVVPLPKANHELHQRDNLHVFDFEITQLDMTKLRAMNEHYSVQGRLGYV